MPIEKLITAFVLGLSWERILCCPFFVMGLTLSDPSAGWKFLLGRLIGVSALGLIITWVGLPFEISPELIDAVFGVFLIAMGISVLLKTDHRKPRKQFGRAGFGLGLFRGLLNPGRKIVYLLPLLWGVKLFDGFVISVTYALSSSAYLLLGLFSANILNKMVAHRKTIRIVSSGILIIMGAYYVFKSYLYK